MQRKGRMTLAGLVQLALLAPWGQGRRRICSYLTAAQVQAVDVAPSSSHLTDSEMSSYRWLGRWQHRENIG